jgi:hypothetical protein
MQVQAVMDARRIFDDQRFATGVFQISLFSGKSLL